MISSCRANPWPPPGRTHVRQRAVIWPSAGSLSWPPSDHDYARAYDVQTGARGPASGREFDPEAAGGPIQPLEAGEARITSAGVQEVTAHLQRFTGAGALAAPEQAMLDRLTSIAAGDTEPASYDLNFYTHELEEAPRATGTGTPGG